MYNQDLKLLHNLKGSAQNFAEKIEDDDREYPIEDEQKGVYQEEYKF